MHIFNMNNLHKYVIAFVLLQHQFQSEAAESGDCPTDCICYTDYLNNLASWKWIQTDINPMDDEMNPDFNPFLDHNEVYDNPLKTWNKLQNKDKMLPSVTCIIRSEKSSALESVLERISPATQVLSILQAPGAANLTMTKDSMSKFRFLIALELQAVTTHDGSPSPSVFRISANALEGHDKLRYLNLHKILLEQAPVTKSVEEDIFVKVRPVQDEGNDDNDMNNDLHPRLLYLGIKEKSEDNILPYSEYKKERIGENEVPTKPMPEKHGEPKVTVAFTRLNKLEHLRISGSHMLDISWDMFYKLTNLKYLLLDNNDLLFLPDFLFYATPNLTALSLAGNRILNLQTVGLAGLLYLEKLDVTHNNITHLSELSLPPFPHLQVADFRYNPIDTIFPNTFEVMNTTKHLYLGSPSTPLTFFANSFYGLVSLITIDVLNVKLGKLDGPMLRGMPLLENFVMDGSIPSIAYDGFSEVPKLKRVVLKKCGLRKISMDAFYGLTQLSELDLSHNQLEFLSPGIFDEQTSLRELYLHHNKLQSLPSSMFGRIPAQLIRLEGNPWHCSCEMLNWDPKITNVAKRYYVDKNTTHCEPQYDKGNACNQSLPVFQAKYVFDKRVSPICQTPTKFMKKSVLQVQRKDLYYCKTTKKIRKPTKVRAESTTLEKETKLMKSIKAVTSPAEGSTSVNTTTTHQIASITIPKVLSLNSNYSKTPLNMAPLPTASMSPTNDVAQNQRRDSNQIVSLKDVTSRLKMKLPKTLPSSYQRQGMTFSDNRNFNSSVPNSSISKKSLKLARLQKTLKSRQF